MGCQSIPIACCSSADQNRFRSVTCQLESLKACQRASAVKDTLQSLPRALDETYERILLAIRPEYHQEVISALLWLVYSKRLLSVDELAEAVVIDINSTTLQPFNVEDRLFNPDNLINSLWPCLGYGR